MAKLKPNESRCQLSFHRPEDVRLFAFLEKQAYSSRHDVSTFILMALQEAFKGQIEDDELSTMAGEAARKVRERATPPVVIPQVHDAPVAPVEPDQPMSDEEAYRQGQEHVARLNAMAPQVFAKKAKRGGGKGVATPPPSPE